ncbi:MAG: M1 family aminopeptidase [Pseudomonadota bacterium]
MMIRLSLISMCLVVIMTASMARADNAIHHEIDLILEPDSGRLDITDRVSVSGRKHLAIKLAAGLTLSEITVDGKAVDAELEKGVSWIILPSEGSHRIDIAYGGSLEPSPPGRGLSPLMADGHAFLPYGIGWLINAGAEDDRVTYRMSLDVPSSFRAVATGKLVSEQESNGRYRAVFTAETPTEPPSIFAGKFVIDEREHRGRRLRTYFPAERRDLASAYLDQASGYIEVFENMIGTYPYDGFSIVAAPLPVGLGFPGATYISSQILHMPFMLTRSLAHEILHNWWANGVFVDYSKGNWAEGLTTFMADYGLAEAEGIDSAWQMRLGWLRDYAALPEERDRPITAFRSKGHDADQVIGYNKVAMVFHMLRNQIGDEAFGAGLKHFWEAHRFRTASWSDLQKSFEDSSSLSLEQFFRPWLTKSGAPALSLDKATLSEQNGSFRLDLELTSDSVDYDMQVPIQIETASGNTERRVRIADGKGKASLDFDEKPLSIGVDQRHDIFRQLAADEAPPILRDVTLDADTLTVIAVNGSDDIEAVAKELATRTLDTGIQLAGRDNDAIANSPLMLVGLTEELRPILAKAGINSVPNTLAGRGTARSWVASREGAPPALIVEANDGDALAALLRPLPHYGRQSYLVFDGRRVTDKGVWTTGDNALTRRFD